ncbi:HDOD domain-containing protein [Pseudomonas aeruginosa]|nr:HDOD domain-containing protein [Pseudomonas aeruginosa]
MHQIGVLPILTYAEDHNELLSDSISLSHVIERIHPLIGERILKAWDFPAPIAEVPRQHLDFTRNSPRADYTDLVQVATLQSYLGSEHPYTRLDWSQIPAFAKLGLEPTVDMKEDEDLSQRPGSRHQHAAIGPPYSAGKRTRTSKPPSSPWSSWICARCARQTSPTIAQPQAAAGAVAAPVEALEDPLAVGGGNSRTIVFHFQHAPLQHPEDHVAALRGGAPARCPAGC